jgi:hypothetical protein
MCTVSFLPRSQGFCLAMNRDEKRDRCAALAPAVVDIESRRAIFPREPAGGTWISANDAGVCLALVNWHRIDRDPKNDALSRGIVIRELAGKSSADEIATGVMKLPLRNLRPFRLIVIAPAETRVVEWRWNLKRLARGIHAWRRRHWFSSGFDERRAESERQRVCAAGNTQESLESMKWLRRLHRSHAPERGPFSICMHRPDASTISYTEICVSRQRATMRYKPGPSCSNGAIVTRTISLAR